MPHGVRIWDLPTRTFHWLLVACVIGLFTTAKIGDTAMDWHARFGWATGSLLMFRVVWGIVGGRWSRFASFVPTPGSVVHYLRSGDERAPVGHNPLGALSVFAMLVVLIAQVSTGLFSASLEDFAGPLNSLVSTPTGKAITRYHRNIGQVLIIILVLLHLGAIAYYRWRRGQDLVGPMLHGDKQLAEAVPGSRDDAVARGIAVVVFLACAGLMSWIWMLGSR